MNHGDVVVVTGYLGDGPKAAPEIGKRGVVVAVGSYILVEFPGWDGGYAFGPNPTGNNRWWFSPETLGTEVDEVVMILKDYDNETL
jgi:predicted permease